MNLAEAIATAVANMSPEQWAHLEELLAPLGDLACEEVRTEGEQNAEDHDSL